MNIRLGSTLYVIDWSVFVSNLVELVADHGPYNLHFRWGQKFKVYDTLPFWRYMVSVYPLGVYLRYTWGNDPCQSKAVDVSLIPPRFKFDDQGDLTPYGMHPYE